MTHIIVKFNSKKETWYSLHFIKDNIFMSAITINKVQAEELSETLNIEIKEINL